MFFSGNPEGSKVGLRLVSSIQIRTTGLGQSPNGLTGCPDPQAGPQALLALERNHQSIHPMLRPPTIGTPHCGHQQTVVRCLRWKKMWGKKSPQNSKQKTNPWGFVGSTLSDSLLDMYAWKPLWRYPCFCWGRGGMDTMVNGFLLTIF